MVASLTVLRLLYGVLRLRQLRKKCMNKAELVDSVAKVTGQSKNQVSDTVAALLHAMTQSMAKGERVTLVGFGTFERRQRKARTGVNPQNPKQKLKIEAAKVPVFRAGQELKDVVDGRAKQAPLPKAVTEHKAEKPAKKAAAKPASKAAKPAKKAVAKKAAPKKVAAKKAAPAKKKPVAKAKKRR